MASPDTARARAARNDTEREKRLSDVFVAGRMTKPDYDREWQEIQQQRATLASAAPAPLFAQQQSVLTALVDAWVATSLCIRTAVYGISFTPREQPE
jgi:hypothetical protein